MGLEGLGGRGRVAHAKALRQPEEHRRPVWQKQVRISGRGTMEEPSDSITQC